MKAAHDGGIARTGDRVANVLRAVLLELSTKRRVASCERCQYARRYLVRIVVAILVVVRVRGSSSLTERKDLLRVVA